MICVPIPVRKIENITDYMRKIRGTSVDLIELRLDYLDSIDISKLKEAFSQVNFPSILTLRKKSEGGYFKENEQARVELLKSLLTLEPDFVDIEHDTPELTELIRLARSKNIKTIISSHDFEKTPNFKAAKKKIETLKSHPVDVVKFITTASSFQDNLIPLMLINNFKDSIKIVAFCMGKLGTFSRIFSPLFGAHFTFASIEETTAPGQVHVDVMRDILNRFRW